MQIKTDNSTRVTRYASEIEYLSEAIWNIERWIKDRQFGAYFTATKFMDCI